MYTSGQIQNLMSTDSRTVADVVLYIHMLWSSVEQIIVSMFLLVSLLGWFATLAGVSFIILSIPLQAVLVSAIKRLREAASYRTDERVKLVSEAIKGIKLVKLYAWELSFVKRILEARSEELNYLRKMAFVQAWNSMLVSSLPTALTIVAFTAFAATGKPLDAAVVFPAIALFNVIRPPLLILPNILINSARAAASLSRLRKFLAADELVPLNEGEHAVNQEVMEQNSLDIVATNASFTWDRSISVAPPTLSSVSFQIPEGSLVAVVGGTGGGKSTLLAGVLGEIPIVSGQAGIRQGRTMSFCDQVPFIRNATVRDNILFGKPFDIDRYKEAIRVCCLLSDLKILPAGDLTEIGGRGVNLSGGQRARVSLARAVYADADICLLDDPLCAVDAHVGKAIFNDCIVSALRGKTRLLTTNQVHFAASHEVDMVMVVHGGTVVEAGNRSELLSNPYSEFARMLEAAGEMGAGEVPSTAVENAEASGIEAEEDADEIGVVIAARAEKTGSSDAKTDAPDYGSIEAGKLTRKETKKKGRVNLKHYATYLSSMGWRQWVLPLVLCGFLSQSFSLSVNVWLSIWSDEKETSNTMFNLIVFLILGVSSVLVTGALAFALACGTIRASVLMHEKLLLSVFGAPSSFFNSTPEGRLVNRFNSDMDKVDQTLGSTLLSLQRLSLSLTFTLGLILWVTPLVVVLVLPVAFICIYIQEFYRKSSVDLRRLEAVARSPLYSHFGETLDGVVTIRAYGDVPRAVNTNNTYTDLLNKTTYASAYANRWLGLRLEALGMTLIFGVTTLAVLTPPGKSSASMIGLVLSYTMQILGVMTWSVRQFTETESQLSAVERVSEYSEPPFPQEEAGGLESFMKEQQELNASMTRTNSAGLISEERMQQLNSGVAHRRHRWPRKGQIDFDRVVMRYREDLPAALREVSFSIRPGEHVGIVGRTGAGKSSAIQSLFRLYELNGGRILIDGVDISSMKLFDLRSSLGVIPQEPVCFSGTIRTNLDMFREHDEDDVQRALDACGLQDTMREKISLDFEVAENGSNLSVGQRQLLCLGRAILKDSQVLVLDEATSSVSNETDQKFQHTLREEMHHCTILTVAHRLHTVMRNDRIIVMDKGMVAEIGKPSELLSGPSRLSALVDETGPATAAHLRNLASIPRGERFADLPGSEQYTNGRRENGVLINGRSGTDDDVSLREQVQAAFLELRTALTDIDSPSWRSELLTAGVEGSQWRGQLRTMVSKLSVLSENLSPPVESDMNGTVESYVAVVPNLSSDMIAEVLQDASPGVGLRKRGKNRSDDDLNENGFVDEKASSRKQ